MPAHRLTLDTPARFLHGVGVVRAAQLARLGVTVVEDLLQLQPQSYLQRGQLVDVGAATPGQRCAVRGILLDVQVIAPRGPSRRRAHGRVVATLGDGHSTLLLTWFNAPWVARRLRVGEQAVVSGEVSQFSGRCQMINPQLESESTLADLRDGRLLAVYPLTSGLRQGILRQIVGTALQRALSLIEDPIPSAWLQELQLPSLTEAISWLHRPIDLATAERAHRRLAFDEALALQLSARARRREWARRAAAVPVAELGDWSRHFVEGLPFELTGAQRRVLVEIGHDLAGPQAMHRLLQGEVGSGKTLVAVIAMIWMAQAGGQAVFLAPTEVLAQQHAERHLRALARVGVRGRLLTSSTPASERAQLLEGLRDGALAVVFGTHALLQDDVEFARLGLAVVDEQHRFGVLQRAQLAAGGAHLLVMSATPIPRSLAMTLYADLDLSVLDEVPKGRPPVRTQVVGHDALGGVLAEVRRRAARGERAYLVYPAIDEGEESAVSGATEAFAELTGGSLRGLRVGLLHGRLPAREKERISRAFAQGDLDVLVATTVVEVGLDVPQATTMVVHDADRFGLAQLHQLRGRVGRGPAGGSCFLVPSEQAGDAARRRLAQVCSLHDGFRLAELDLQVRGMGDLHGVRQHGDTRLRFLRPLEHAALLARARELAEEVLAVDPQLDRAEHAPLRAWLSRLSGRASVWAFSG